MVKILAIFSVLIAVNSAQAQGDSDAAIMEKARILYAKNELPKAIEAYSLITPSSDFWLDALEEKAWAHTRQGNFENALADLQSVTSAVWSSQVGPEAYMLSTFVSLKICAYKDVIKKISIFKKRMKPRVDALQKIMDEPLPESFWAMSSALKGGKVSMVSIGQKAENFPRYFYRDHQLLNALQAGQTAKVQARMKQLAQQDLDEIEVNLKKMKIIDVELIQKVLMADKDEKKNKDLRFTKIDRDRQLLFPVDNDDEEVWVDEVGHYQVKAEKCPYSTPSRSSL